MSTLNKVLIGLILVASIAFFILGARALKTHQYWCQQAAQIKEALATEQNSYEELREQVRQLKRDLHAQVVDRGRAWYGCRPQPSPDTQRTGEVVVTVEFPDPHQITPNSVVWVFDELPMENGGRYLGQFVVAAVGGQGNMQVQLRPSARMIEKPEPEGLKQLTRLAQSAGRNGATWTLYEIMPIDNHEALAELSDDQLKAVLPQKTADEYVADGQLMTLEEVKQRGLAGNVYRIDANEEVVKVDGVPQEVAAETEKGKYVRQLRDYEESFRQHRLARTMLEDRIATTERNLRYVTEAKQDADQQLRYRQDEHDRLATELKQAERERDLVAAHLQVVQGALDALRTTVQETIQKNQALAGEIARIQREATQIINEQTHAMAQAGPGS